MNRIYLDNAATSFPKAPGVGKAVYDYIEKSAVNLYRTESRESEKLFSSIYELRLLLSSLFSYDHPECIVFTSNATEALNLAIKGLAERGSKVITTSNEHNAVMRPLSQIGAKVIKLPSDRKGRTIWDKREINGASLIVVNAAGNVSGAVEDLHPIAELAKKLNIPLVIDGSQAVPFVDINMTELNAAAICIPGHKGLLGPEGTGAAILRRDIAESIEPLITGGTGTESDLESVPHTLPERLSGGTENLPGLIGLEAALSYVMENKEDIKENAMKMTERLYNGLEQIEGVTIHGPAIDEERTPIISITSDKKDIAFLSAALLERGGVETRVGLHCSPSAHKSLGTYPGGTLRFSPGPFTSDDEIDMALETLKEAINE